jgi:hypothetical protein
VNLKCHSSKSDRCKRGSNGFAFQRTMSARCRFKPRSYWNMSSFNCCFVCLSSSGLTRRWSSCTMSSTRTIRCLYVAARRYTALTRSIPILSRKIAINWDHETSCFTRRTCGSIKLLGVTQWRVSIVFREKPEILENLWGPVARPFDLLVSGLTRQLSRSTEQCGNL